MITAKVIKDDDGLIKGEEYKFRLYPDNSIKIELNRLSSLFINNFISFSTYSLLNCPISIFLIILE